ncbi:unnamed protein product [Adineta ricciae]|uniref:Uncharacterized protein n=1 Tax=Adineta ricciae TaxID=249248 RepID=A0A813UY95_ADIRI|nr:unnamed protein product [Adineta ricciae]CAF0977835.1 unnamed protein product [Adineta ricciae]
MAERKAFNIIKAVPVVGHAYGAVRGVVYAAKGDRSEAKHSIELDLADLNPLRIPKKLVHGIQNATHNLEEGAWIGRRALFKQPLALNITPGMDGFHWCIQINGVIYQLGVDKDRDIKIHISSRTEKTAYYERDCKEYSWYLIQNELPAFDADELRAYAKSFEDLEYRMFLALGNKMNCQSFVTRMFAIAAKISIEKARSTILLVIPNLLF